MSQNMDYPGSRGEMPCLPNEQGKKRCIDDIIEHMTADLQSYEGQYILLGSPPPPPPPTAGHPVWSSPPPPPQPQGVYYQPVNESNEMMMMDVGGGKYVNVLFKQGSHQEYSQPPLGFIHYQQPQNLVQPHIIDYGQRGYNHESMPNGCLIENVVGNWVPNRTGTYSPFPGVPQEDPVILPQQPPIISQPPQSATAPVKKQRIVAEVKPMRPSYSDVLSKSPPLTPPPTVKTATKPVVSPPLPPLKSEPKKPQNKPISVPNGKANNNLKRENSVESNEALTEKARAAIRRWLSQEFEPPVKQEAKKEKRKQSKQKKKVPEKEEKVESEEKDVECPKMTQKKETINHTITSQYRPQTKSKTKERDERRSSSSKSERVNVRSSKSKRSQRSSRKKESPFGAFCRKWQEKCLYYVIWITSWLINLLWDVTTMSATLLIHFCSEMMMTCKVWVQTARSRGPALFKSWRKKKKPPEPPPFLFPGGLLRNISLPVTGEEAMKRLLACKGKDPYSILGVTSTCSDEEIKKYYKSQALLVHPDKNPQPGAEEAFKILVHAFDLIAEPDKRAEYDRFIAETTHVERAWTEMSTLLTRFHELMDCSKCGDKHSRVLTNRPTYAARYCGQCKIHHSVKEGDMWCESRAWGLFSSKYYACMEGAVYDISLWANCQGTPIKNLKPNTHLVQFRVLSGRSHFPNETDLEDLFNSIYAQSGSGGIKKRTKRFK